MSTGDELVEATKQPQGPQIRDSNRPALLAAFEQDGYQAFDLGIVKDTVEVLRAEIAGAVSRCDVVITSGGVSMGEADYVKTILQELGAV
jgi:molybdenum cofactor synthesis domain-containing protein